MENNSLKKRKELTNIKLISRLLKGRVYSKRAVGHRGEDISPNAMKDCKAFLFEIIELRRKYKFKAKNILVCDEIAFCLNNPANKTIIKKGIKTVNCKALKREKLRIILLNLDKIRSLFSI